MKINQYECSETYLLSLANPEITAKQEWPKKCPYCGDKSLYDKSWINEPNLSHCANCQIWIDEENHLVWTWHSGLLLAIQFGLYLAEAWGEPE